MRFGYYAVYDLKGTISRRYLYNKKLNQRISFLFLMSNDIIKDSYVICI